MAGVLPPGISISTEDDHRQRFNQISENIIHDDGTWVREPVALGQRINMLIIMLTRLFTHAEEQEIHAGHQDTFTQETQANIVEIKNVIENLAQTKRFE